MRRLKLRGRYSLGPADEYFNQRQRWSTSPSLYISKLVRAKPAETRDLYINSLYTSTLVHLGVDAWFLGARKP